MSEGAIANLLTRVKARFGKSLAEILTHLRAAKLICSDETSARVKAWFNRGWHPLLLGIKTSKSDQVEFMKDLP